MTSVERQKIVDNTNASFFLEGIKPDGEMMRLQALYVTGEIANAFDLGKLVRSHLKLKNSEAGFHKRTIPLL